MWNKRSRCQRHLCSLGQTSQDLSQMQSSPAPKEGKKVAQMKTSQSFSGDAHTAAASNCMLATFGVDKGAATINLCRHCLFCTLRQQYQAGHDKKRGVCTTAIRPRSFTKVCQMCFRTVSLSLSLPFFLSRARTRHFQALSSPNIV